MDTTAQPVSADIQETFEQLHDMEFVKNLNAEREAADLEKKLKRRRYIVRSFLLFIYVAIAYGFVELGLRAKAFLATAPQEQFMKSCSVTFGSGREVQGLRVLSIPSYSIFGYRITDTSAVTEQTKVYIRGEPVTIIGQSPTEWWSRPIGAGEQYDQLIAPASQLTFVYGDKQEVAIISYKDFCR